MTQELATSVSPLDNSPRSMVGTNPIALEGHIAPSFGLFDALKVKDENNNGVYDRGDIKYPVRFNEMTDAMVRNAVDKNVQFTILGTDHDTKINGVSYERQQIERLAESIAKIDPGGRLTVERRATDQEIDLYKRYYRGEISKEQLVEQGSQAAYENYRKSADFASVAMPRQEKPDAPYTIEELREQYEFHVSLYERTGVKIYPVDAPLITGYAPENSNNGKSRDDIMAERVHLLSQETGSRVYSQVGSWHASLKPLPNQRLDLVGPLGPESSWLGSDIGNNVLAYRFFGESVSSPVSTNTFAMQLRDRGSSLASVLSDKIFDVTTDPETGEEVGGIPTHHYGNMNVYPDGANRDIPEGTFSAIFLSYDETNTIYPGYNWEPQHLAPDVDTGFVKGSLRENPIGGSLSDALLSSTSLTQPVFPAPGDALGREIFNAVASTPKTLFKDTPFGQSIGAISQLGNLAPILARTGNVDEAKFFAAIGPLSRFINVAGGVINGDPVDPLAMGSAAIGLFGLFGNDETKKLVSDVQQVIGVGDSILKAIKINSLPKDQLAQLGPNAAQASILNAATAVFNLLGPKLGASADVMKWGNILLGAASLAMAWNPIGFAMLVYNFIDAVGVIKKPEEIRFSTKIDTTGDGTADKTNLLLKGGFKYMPWDQVKDLQLDEARLNARAVNGYVDPADGAWKPETQYTLEGRAPPPGVAMTQQFFLEGSVRIDDFNPHSKSDWHHFAGLPPDSRTKKGFNGEPLYTADDWKNGLIPITGQQYSQIRALDPKGDGVTLDPSHPIVQTFKDQMLARVPPGELTFVQHGMGPGFVRTPDLNNDGHHEVLQQFLTVELGDKKIGSGDGSFKLTVGGPWDQKFAVTGNDGGELAALVRAGPVVLELVASDPALIAAYNAAEQSDSPDKGAVTLFRQLVDMKPEDRPRKTFDWAQYAAANPDVYAAFDGNPWLITEHYIKAGAAEGRQTAPDDPIKGAIAARMMKDGGFAYEYAASYPSDLGKLVAEGKMDHQDLVNHFLNSGHGEGRLDWGFDAVAYLAQNTDVLKTIGKFDKKAAVEHYLTYGKNEGRKLAPDDPGVTESLRTILGDQDAALAYAAGQPPLFAGKAFDFENAPQIAAMHYATEGRFAVEPPKIVDPDAYMVSNSDVYLAANGDRTKALEHYMTYGYAEGRNTTIDNDAERLAVRMLNNPLDRFEYLMSNRDVAAAVGNDDMKGLEHFLSSGQFEGRKADLSARTYRLLNPDLITAGLDPIAAARHFLTNGANEGRKTGPQTDGDRSVLQIASSRENATRYLAGNPQLVDDPTIGFDLNAAVDHFATKGRFENPIPAMFDPNAALLRRPGLMDKVGFSAERLAQEHIREGRFDPGANTPVGPAALAMLRRLRSSPAEAYAMMASYPDLRVAFKDDSSGVIKHFIASGQYEKRGISFDEEKYKAANPDLTPSMLAARGVGSVAEYHVKYGADEGRPLEPSTTAGPTPALPADFDPWSYLATHADVRGAAQSTVPAGATLTERADVLENFAERHYATAGNGEGRITDGFDEADYEAKNPDVMQNPLFAMLDNSAIHRVLYGDAEGRVGG